MITMEQYVGQYDSSPDWTAARQLNAAELLVACWELEKLPLPMALSFQIILPQAQA